MAAPLAADARARHAWRDRFLGFSAIVFAGSAVLFAVASLLQLIDALQGDAPTGYSVGAVFQMLSPIVAIPALALASAAFLLARRRRSSLLGMAALILVAAFTAGVVGDILFASVAATHDIGKKVIAAYSAAAVSDIGLVVAAAFAAAAFFAVAARGAQALNRRDGLLGFGSICIAVFFAFTATSTILFLLFYSDVGAVGGYTTGVGMAAGGEGVGVVAAILVAAAFFISMWRQQQERAGWLTGRDLTLGVGLAILALAFLLTAIGVVVVATADPKNGITGKQAASDWLAAVGYFGLLLTAACASLGFFLSRGTVHTT
jgi:hypothetical protein